MVKFPGHSTFASLGADSLVPIGSVIDAARGVVNVVTQLSSGHTQSVTVWGGSFEVKQGRHGVGATQIYVRGALPLCPRAGARTSSAARHASRTLWARDNHGRYSTHGANSVATVMGTEWETIDTCAGTWTHVLRGRVRVRELHGHRTGIVSAGNFFLARR
jgi:hypothetical protein